MIDRWSFADHGARFPQSVELGQQYLLDLNAYRRVDRDGAAAVSGTTLPYCIMGHYFVWLCASGFQKKSR